MEENKKQKNQKKQKVLKLCGLVGLFLLVFGVSFALFRVTLNGTKKNRLTTGRLSLELLDKNDNPIYEEATDGTVQTGTAIDLTNAVPISDEEGMKTEPFEFKIKNNGTIPAHYDLKLIDEESSTLNRQYIKYVLEREDWNKKSDNTMYRGGFDSNEYGNYPYEGNGRGELLSTLENDVLDSTTLLPGEEMHFKLRIWINEAATYEDAGNKTYESNLKLVGSQTRVIYKGKSGTNIETLLYDDGTIVLNGTGAMEGLTVNEGDEVPDFTSAKYSGIPYFEIINQVVKKVNPNGDLTANNESAFAWIQNIPVLTSKSVKEQALPSSAITQVNQMFDQCISGNTTMCETEPIDGFMFLSSNDPVKAKKIFEEVFVNLPIFNRVLVTEGITSVAPIAFAGGQGTMVTLPSTVTDLGTLPFLSSKAYGVIVPEGITNMQETYFSGDNDLEVLYVPDSVVSGTFNFDNMGISKKFIIDNSETFAKANWTSDFSYSDKELIWLKNNN